VLDDWAVPSGSEPATVDRSRHPVAHARWTPGEISRVVSRLAERGAAALEGVSLERRLEVWNDTVAAFLEPGSEERERLFAPLVTSARLSPEGLSEALEVIVGGAGPGAAAELVARLPEARPRRPATVILASNVPGLAVQTLLPALLLGRPLLLKSSHREPLFTPAWIRALAAREPALADAFAAVSWLGDDTTALRAAAGASDRVVAYGGDEAMRALAHHYGARLVALGPRASVALVAGVHDPLGTARALARDVALLDQRGCLSVQAIYVAGDAAVLADALAYALAAEHRRLPPGPPEPEAAARVQQLRGAAALRGALIGDLDTAQGSVLLEPHPTFRPSPGLRLVRLHPVASLDDALAALERARGSLQGAALAGDEAVAREAEITIRLGLARVAPAGRLQHAEAGWAAGGIDPLDALAGASPAAAPLSSPTDRADR